MDDKEKRDELQSDIEADLEELEKELNDEEEEEQVFEAEEEIEGEEILEADSEGEEVGLEESESDSRPTLNLAEFAGIDEEEGDGSEHRGSAAERTESDEILESTRNRNILEGALFVAGRPVSIDELQVKTDFKKAEIESIMQDLMLEYMERPTALEIVLIQDKYSLQIKPEYTPKVKKFASGGLIPDSILKTLTIIALKQPLMKSMLIKLRGATAYDHVKFLIDRGYINAFKKGRSFELSTTDQFADTFGLSRDLNTLKKQMITQLGVQEE